MTGASIVYMDLFPPYVLLEDLLVLDDLLADAGPPLLSGKPHPLFGGLLVLEEDERDDLFLALFNDREPGRPQRGEPKLARSSYGMAVGSHWMLPYFLPT